MKKLAVLIVALTWAPVFGADVPELINQLKDKDAEVRRKAATELAEAGPAAKEAAPALARALKDQDKFVRRFAAQALGAIGPEASGVIPELRKTLLSDTGKEVHLAVVETLGKIGYSSASVDALTGVIKDGSKDAEVRRKAADALAKFGAPAHSAVKVLTDALSGGPKMPRKGVNDDDVRLALVTALGELATANDKAALAAVTNLTDRKANRNRGLLQAANQAVRKIEARK